jgi:hypothetical protein
MQEKIIWKDVPGYEGYYQVNNLGQVKGLERLVPHHRPNGTIIAKIKERLLSPCIHKGYASVHLTKNCIGKVEKVHKLVALAFIENPESKKYINHINGIKNDNRLENLEWVTPKENSRHAINNNLFIPYSFIGTNNPKNKLKEEDIIYIRNNNKEYSLNELSEKYKVSANTISHIIRRKTWKHVL